MKTFKYLLIMVVIGWFFAHFVSDSFAAGNPDTYKVTVQSVQLKNDAGNWVTIATPNQEIDIADAGVGAVAGSFMNDAVIPPGNYVNFKIVLSETVKFSGSDGATNFTRSGGSITLTGGDANAASTATWVDPLPVTTQTEAVESHHIGGPAGEVTVHLNLDAGDADDYMEVLGKADLTNPVVVTANSAVSMYFDFDTQGTVLHQAVGPPVDEIMIFTPPKEGTRFGITVDGTSLIITEADMRIDF